MLFSARRNLGWYIPVNKLPFIKPTQLKHISASPEFIVTAPRIPTILLPAKVIRLPRLRAQLCARFYRFPGREFGRPENQPDDLV
jgi:hypothetical protein